MNNTDIKKYDEKDIYALCNYFSDHPIMLIGVSLAGTILGVCLILDKKIQ